MQNAKLADNYEFGQQLVESISIPEKKLNFLFAALFLTSLGVFIGGNLPLLDAAVAKVSAQITLACLAVLLIFYMLARSTGSVTWGLVLIYGLMWIVVYSRQAWLIPVVYGMALLSLGYLVKYMRIGRAQWGLVLLMAMIASTTVLGVSRAYTSFDMLNRLHAGNVVQDTLYHASIAAMIKNYGVVSTGLHGLVETPYHVLSHVLFAGTGLLSKASIFEVYGVANWVLFAPILIFAAVACTAMLDRENRLSLALGWSTACVLLAASPFLFQKWAVWDSFFVSESDLVSLGLFLLGLPLLFKRRVSPTDLLLVLILSAMISYAKVSVGLIYAGLWLARAVFVRGESLRLDMAALILSAVMAAWFLFGAEGGRQETISISPLHFIREYSFLGNEIDQFAYAMLHGETLPLRSGPLVLAGLLGFFTFHFFFSWVVIGQTALRNGILSVFRVPIAVYALASVFAGVLIVMLFRVPGGSAGYFTNVAFFAALPGVVAMLVYALGMRRATDSLLLMSGMLLLVFNMGAEALYNGSVLHPIHSNQENNALIDSLIEVRHSAPLDVVLQPDEEVFANNPVSRCTAQPFVFPAISERPWVDVIQVHSDCTYEYYGYGQYGMTESHQNVTIAPQILPGMTIRGWSQTVTDFRMGD